MRYISILILLAVPNQMLGQTDSTISSGEVWYKVATGIVGVPAAIFALLLTVSLLRKTSLESRKLELEISSRSQTLAIGKSAPTVEEVMRPVNDGSRVLLLLVRFILLEITLRLWNIIPTVFSALTKGAGLATFYFGGEHFFENLDPSSGFGLVLFAGSTLVGLLFGAIYWTIVIGFGWPLFRDICGYLNIPISRLQDLRHLVWSPRKLASIPKTTPLGEQKKSPNKKVDSTRVGSTDPHESL